MFYHYQNPPQQFFESDHPHILSGAFTLIELMFAINHQSSVTSDPNGLSRVFFKHLPQIAYTILLNILNHLWLNSLISPSWKKFKVFQTSKSNSQIFQPISLSAYFCKIDESILKKSVNRNQPKILNNMYGFCRRLGRLPPTAQSVFPFIFPLIPENTHLPHYDRFLFPPQIWT